MKRLACALLVVMACGDDDGSTDAGRDAGADVPTLEDAGNPPDGGPLFDGGTPMHPRLDCTLGETSAPAASWLADVDGEIRGIAEVDGQLVVAHTAGVTTFAIGDGDGTLAAAETFAIGEMGLEAPSAVTARGADYFVSDSTSIHRFTFDGSSSSARLLQGADTDLGRLESPGALAVDSLGQLFVTDTTRNDLRVFGVSDELQVRELWGDSRYASSGGDLGPPSAVAIDHVRNRVYVADDERIVVFRYTDGAHIATIIRAQVLGLVLDRHGFLYASDATSVAVFEPESMAFVFEFSSGASTGGTLALVESNGQRYLALADGMQVRGVRLAEVHERACVEQLRVTTPNFLQNAAQSLRVELLRPDGEHDVLSFRQPGRVVVTRTDGSAVTESEFTLYNGMGSAPLQIDVEGEVAIRVEVAGHIWAETTTVATTAPTNLTGTLTGDDLTWSGAVQLSGLVIVPPGETLTIEAGTNVLLEPGALLQVDGDLTADATDANPIAIFGTDTTNTWSQIHHRGVDSTYLYRNVLIRGGGNHEDEWTYRRWKHCCPPILYFEAGDVTMERVVIGDSPNKSLMISDGTIVMRECAVNRVAMGPEFELPSTELEDLWITEIRGIDDNDGIYFWKVGQCCGVPTDVCTAACGEPYPESVVTARGLVIADVDDDGVDTQFSYDFLGPATHPASPDLRDVIIYGIADKGMSLAGGNTVVTNALIFANGNLGVKTDDNNPLREDHPDVSTILRNTTIVDNPNHGVFVGVQGASMFSDGSHITVSILDDILWDNGTQVETVFREQEITIQRSVNPSPIGSVSSDNLTSDPRFIDPQRLEYRLNPRSPAATLAEDGGPAGFRGF